MEFLYPLSTQEIINGTSRLAEKRLLETRLVYGMYPEIVSHQTQDKAEHLKSLARSYLYKDILVFQKIRHSEVLENKFKLKKNYTSPKSFLAYYPSASVQVVTPDNRESFIT